MNTDKTTFKKGDSICFTWGVKDIFEVALKPRFKSGIEYITIEIDGRRKEMLAQSFRKALSVEVERKQRIDDSEELKKLGGISALIDLFGVDVLKKAIAHVDEELNCDGVHFTRNEAIAALKEYERVAIASTNVFEGVDPEYLFYSVDADNEAYYTKIEPHISKKGNFWGKDISMKDAPNFNIHIDWKRSLIKRNSSKEESTNLVSTK